jgi:hypothetical protein
MLVLWICAIMVVIARYPETPIGRVLKRLLVDKPAEALAKLTLTRAILLLAIIAIGAAVIHFARSDLLMVVAQGAPETVGWFFALDVGAYFDVIALAVLAAASLSLRALYGRARSALQLGWRLTSRVTAALGHRLSVRQRSPRRRPGARTPPSSDDERGLGWAFAAYQLS